MSYTGRTEPRSAFDPLYQPQLFDGVLSRRLFAYLIDVFYVSLLWCLVGVLVFFLGIATFGLAWALFGILWPLIGLAYTVTTLGGAGAATPGMSAMGLTMRMWYGAKPDPLIALMHVVLFYVAATVLTPFIHLIGLFTARRQLLHDLVLGTVLVNKGELERLGAA